MISSTQLSSASAVLSYHADAFSADHTREGAQYELTLLHGEGASPRTGRHAERRHQIGISPGWRH